MTTSTQNRNDAYREIQGNLPMKRRKVYQAIKKNQPCNAKGIALHLGWPINSVTGRITELRDWHCLIKEYGSSKNMMSNVLNTLYVTSAPSEVPILMERKIAEMQHEISLLEDGFDQQTNSHCKAIIGKEILKAKNKLIKIKQL